MMPHRTPAFAAAILGVAAVARAPGPLSVAGVEVCRLAAGTPRHRVQEVCGHPTGFGTQPKVRRSWSIEMCSAPGDVYGEQVVLYDCEGRARVVERRPVAGFVENAE
jgi:hypothetical protein